MPRAKSLEVSLNADLILAPRRKPTPKEYDKSLSGLGTWRSLLKPFGWKKLTPKA